MHFFFFVVVVPQVEVTKSTCNSTTNKVETGTINTPKYPKDYGSNSRCEWLITSSHRIKLVFNYFFVENGWDYFHVYEGKSTSSKRIGKLTGGHTNKVIKSSGNYLYLKFTSDSVINKKGFLIAYEGNSVTSLILLLLWVYFLLVNISFSSKSFKLSVCVPHFSSFLFSVLFKFVT